MVNEVIGEGQSQPKTPTAILLTCTQTNAKSGTTPTHTHRASETFVDVSYGTEVEVDRPHRLIVIRPGVHLDPRNLSTRKNVRVSRGE